METDAIKYIPNAFYDMMVFVVPTTQLCGFVYLGLYGFDVSVLKNITGTSLIALLIGIVLLSYEYGRMAEALSAYVVQNPLKFIGKHTRFFKHEDFLRTRKDIYNILGLKNCYDGRTGDKWAIYLQAFNKKPSIGSDLLKRYAWEKLSRNSAFTYVLLLTLSIVRLLYCLLFQCPIGWLPFRFGNGSFTAMSFILTYLTYVEYYKRNIWNYDLLTKAIPIILS